MIVLIEPDDALSKRLLGLLPASDVIYVNDVAAATDRMRQLDSEPVTVVLGPGLGLEAALQFAEKSERSRRGVATLLVAQDLDASALREALRAGIDDVLTVSATADEWDESLARADHRARSALDPDADSIQDDGGRIVSVFSTKGGCGKSLVASNLAVLTAQRLEQRTVLVDLDLQAGDLSIMFQLMPALSIFDAAQNAAGLDEEAMQGYLTPHRSGVSLLAAPMEPSLAEQVEPSAVTAILGLLPRMFPVVIVDGPPLFTEQMLVALDLSDEVILVGSMDVPSIKNLKLAVNTITQLGHARESLRIVLNRADSKVGLRASEVEKSLGVTIDVQIPSSRDVPLSINQGNPLAISRPRSPVVQAIAQLVDGIASGPDSGDQRARRRRRR